MQDMGHNAEMEVIMELVKALMEGLANDDSGVDSTNPMSVEVAGDDPNAIKDGLETASDLMDQMPGEPDDELAEPSLDGDELDDSELPMNSDLDAIQDPNTLKAALMKRLGRR